VFTEYLHRVHEIRIFNCFYIAVSLQVEVVLSYCNLERELCSSWATVVQIFHNDSELLCLNKACYYLCIL
jgi:hypothetical protein